MRGLAGGVLAGDAHLSTTEVMPIEKPVGPETLAGGGESRTFAFTVAKKGLVGIGIRAGQETLECELLTRDEKLLGLGIQQFVQLDVGTYLLRVSSAADSSGPVRFAPVVVGLEPPSEGPPEEYLRQFLQDIGVNEGGN